MTSSSEASSKRATTQLAVSGLNCNNCARKVTGILQGFGSVASVAVDLDRQSATLRWKPDAADELPALLIALDKAGYSSRVITGEDEPATGMMGSWTLNLAVGIPITAVLMLGEWVLQLHHHRWYAWLSFALAAVVQVLAGGKFYRGAWAQLKAGSSNMDTLVSLGSTTAFGYSTWALLAGWTGHLYFMEAAAIITLISLGHWIEARVGEKAAGSLKALMTLAPQTARKLSSGPDVAPGNSTPRPVPGSLLKMNFRPYGQDARATTESEVPVVELRVDDLVALRPGDRVPVDGVVTEGVSAVDESMLTGESTPVDKAVKSSLYAGTTNINGRLVMRVTATGESTALAHIIAAVERAQSSRANIQRLGDKVSNVFVPVVCALALATALWWGLGFESAKAAHDFLGRWLWASTLADTALAAAFIGAAAVLIIACPCAMGLATPAAIMAAANTAAKRGILIRDGVALEKAGAVTAVLFDKTGTLTEGKPRVAAIWDGRRRREESLSNKPEHASGESGQLEPPHVGCYGVEELARSLAKDSTHPISRAIVSWGSGDSAERRHSVDVQSAALSRDAATRWVSWREVRGSGIEARSNTAQTLRLGSQRWLHESGVDLRAGESFANEWSGKGATVIGLAADAELLALFAVQDALKSGAAHVVNQLHSAGLKTYMITGDNPSTAQGIASEVGIAKENVFAEVKPEQKAEFVKKLQAQGEKVAFVGDGINDAPALEQSDLGIAVSRASDVAREAADIILLKSDIEAVPESLGLARASLRTIKQNLFWAFFYNAAAVPLAVLGFMSPVLCAAAMGLSDLVVIGNALRLRNWRHKD